MSAEVATARAVAQRNLTRATQTLLGICAGLVADGQINDREVAFLSTWLAENQEVAAIWPGSAIAQRLRDVLADGVITAEEKESLVTLLQQLSGNEFADTGAAAPAAPGIPCDFTVDVVFDGKSFCFTGEFAFGTRAACHKAVARTGGLPADGVTSRLDYLVVGAGCSPDWANTTYGRKIEAALEKQAKLGRPAIIAEAHWFAALERFGQIGGQG